MGWARALEPYWQLWTAILVPGLVPNIRGRLKYGWSLVPYSLRYKYSMQPQNHVPLGSVQRGRHPRNFRTYRARPVRLQYVCPW